MRKKYFKKEPGPQPLSASVERRVRFEDCDMLGIMWHGRYASFFEDAREALADKYGISYTLFSEYGVLTPIVSFHSDFIKPLQYRHNYVVKGILHWTEAAKINIEYEIASTAGEVHTRGYSVQLLVDMQGQLLFAPPTFYTDFLNGWQSGKFA